MNITVKVIENREQFYAVVIDNDNSGTHKDCHVVYNGMCSLKFHDTIEDALSDGDDQKNMYLNRYDDLNHFCAYMGIKGGNKKELISIINELKSKV